MESVVALVPQNLSKVHVLLEYVFINLSEVLDGIRDCDYKVVFLDENALKLRYIFEFVSQEFGSLSSFRNFFERCEKEFVSTSEQEKLIHSCQKLLSDIENKGNTIRDLICSIENHSLRVFERP